MKKWLFIAVFGLGVFALGRYSATDSPQSFGPITANVESPDSMYDGGGADGIAEAYTRRLQNVSVQAGSRVVKVLPDDN